MTESQPAPGWVYILTNPALPGMVKVGLTTRNLAARAAELASSSGVPLPFAVTWARAVTDCAMVERAVRRMLDDKRVSGKREFFRVDVATARQVIEAAAGSALGRRYKPRPAALKRSGKRRRKRGRDLDRLRPRGLCGGSGGRAGAVQSASAALVAGFGA